MSLHARGIVFNLSTTQSGGMVAEWEVDVLAANNHLVGSIPCVLGRGQLTFTGLLDHCVPQVPSASWAMAEGYWGFSKASSADGC